MLSGLGNLPSKQDQRLSEIENVFENDAQTITYKTNEAGDLVEDSNPKSTKAHAQQDVRSKQSAFGILSLSYWRAYFDISDIEVKERVISCLNPIEPTLSSLADQKADLYGPFWICFVQVFALSISGEFLSLISSFFSNESYKSSYTISNIGTAVWIVYGALVVFPLIWYFINKFFGAPISLIYSISIYGYSLTIYLLASLICIISADSFRYLFFAY